jgi:serpin B
MWTRRQALRALGVAGIAAPALTACGGSDGAGGVGQDRSGQSAAGLRLVSADVARSPGDPGAADGVVESMRAFTLDLWNAVGASGDNLALSPYSIAVALAMTTNGARGATSRAMEEVLHIDSLATYNAGLAALTQELAGLAGPVTVAGKAGEIALDPANQLFGDQEIHWRQGFLTVLAKEYGAGMRTVDFRHDAQGARALVNDWAAQQTHGRIPDILPSDAVDTLTRLVLVNALYFKAPWDVPFEKESTRPGPFTRADGNKVSAQLMVVDEGPTYVEGTHFRGARLLYAGGRLAMTVALPQRGSESVALSDLLAHGLGGRGQSGLKLTMPRWTYRVATDLSDPLTTLGMGIAFGAGATAADFTGMTDDVELAITDVLHQTYVAVDEAGTEAAAATAVVMGDTSMPVSQQELVLDRPFLYAIHDTAHGTPLFVGRVSDPSS